jgi:hypothetical protein
LVKLPESLVPNDIYVEMAAVGALRREEGGKREREREMAAIGELRREEGKKEREKEMTAVGVMWESKEGEGRGE